MSVPQAVSEAARRPVAELLVGVHPRVKYSYRLMAERAPGPVRALLLAILEESRRIGKARLAAHRAESRRRRRQTHGR